MAEEDIAESSMPESLDCRSTLIITQVPTSLYDPHLEFVCIRSLHQHIHIVIGLNHHGLGHLGKAHSFVSHTADVRHDYKQTSVDLDCIANGLSRIVRHNEVSHLAEGHVCTALLSER